MGLQFVSGRSLAPGEEPHTPTTLKLAVLKLQSHVYGGYTRCDTSPGSATVAVPLSPYACGNGVDLPHLAKRAVGDQMGPNMQTPCRLAVPLIKD